MATKVLIDRKRARERGSIKYPFLLFRFWYLRNCGFPLKRILQYKLNRINLSTNDKYTQWSLGYHQVTVPECLRIFSKKYHFLFKFIFSFQNYLISFRDSIFHALFTSLEHLFCAFRLFLKPRIGTWCVFAQVHIYCS